jgi:hypothetical protein
MGAKASTPRSDEAPSCWTKPVELAASTAASSGQGTGSTRQQFDAQVTDMFAFARSQSH